MMILLIFGVLFWSFVYFFKWIVFDVCVFMGNCGVGLVVLVLFGFIVLMVIGYCGVDSIFLWDCLSWGGLVNNLFMVIVIYFVMSGFKCGVLFYCMCYLMLIGFLIWIVLYFLVNGDSVLFIFFGGFGFWVLVIMCIINWFEFDWMFNEKGVFLKDILFFVIVIVFIGVIGVVYFFFGLILFGV